VHGARDAVDFIGMPEETWRWHKPSSISALRQINALYTAYGAVQQTWKTRRPSLFRCTAQCSD